MTLRKKVLAAVVGIAVVMLRERFNLSDEQVSNITLLIAAYLGGQGLADFGKSQVEVEAVPAPPAPKPAARGRKTSA